MTRLERIAMERARLAELTALRRPLTDAEAEEVVRLDERERRRAANRAWRERNLDREIERIRGWRIANMERVRAYRRHYRQMEAA